MSGAYNDRAGQPIQYGHCHVISDGVMDLTVIRLVPPRRHRSQRTRREALALYLARGFVMNAASWMPLSIATRRVIEGVVALNPHFASIDALARFGIHPSGEIR